MSANADGNRAGTGNQFLDALPAEARRRCTEQARPWAGTAGETIALRGDRFEDVCLPTHGAVSEVEEGLDGGSAEVTVVGYEGISPIEALLDLDAEPFRRALEVPARGLAIPVAVLRRLRDEDADLHRLIHRYAGARLRAAGITIACNARHDAPSRLARWLLRMSDRVAHGHFELTHETIALMLGVRRPTVTRAIAELVAAGAIASERHSVRIIERARLEALTCSCYPDARGVFNEIYGNTARTTEI